jgi:hypothetical protein
VVIVLAGEDVEVHLHALQTVTDQFQHSHLGKLSFENVWIMGCT